MISSRAKNVHLTKEVKGRNGEILNIGSKDSYYFFFCSFKTIDKLALLLVMQSGKLKSPLAEADIIPRPQYNNAGN